MFEWMLLPPMVRDLLAGRDPYIVKGGHILEKLVEGSSTTRLARNATMQPYTHEFAISILAFFVQDVKSVLEVLEKSFRSSKPRRHAEFHVVLIEGVRYNEMRGSIDSCPVRLC